MTAILITVTLVEDELSNLAEIHEQSRFVVELILEVLSEPGAVAGDDVQVDRAQTVLFGGRFIRGHFARDAILISLTFDCLTIGIEEVPDWADL